MVHLGGGNVPLATYFCFAVTVKSDPAHAGVQAIYSAHLKLHPLLVLAVLVVAEHSLGVWGLLLAGACFPRAMLRYLSTYAPVFCLGNHPC